MITISLTENEAKALDDHLNLTAARLTLTAWNAAQKVKAAIERPRYRITICKDCHHQVDMHQPYPMCFNDRCPGSPHLGHAHYIGKDDVETITVESLVS